MVTDNTEKKALEIKLTEQRVQQHIRITKAVVTAQEKERSEIGEELHDNVNQLLAAAQLYFTYSLDPNRSCNSYPKRIGVCEDCDGRNTKIVSCIDWSWIQDTMGLCSSVAELAKDMFVNRNIRFVFNHSTYDENESEEGLKLVIYRIIQEQMNNIIKHAEATEVKIELIKNKMGTTTIIEDNGKGFDTSLKRDGIGLKNIRHRTEIHNGSVTINSSPGLGCKMTVSFGEQRASEN